MKNLIKEMSPFNNIESENKIRYTIKVLLKTFLVFGISILIASVLVVGFQIALSGDTVDEQMEFNIMLLLKYYGYIVTIMAFIIFIRKFEKGKIEEIGINKNFKTFFKGVFIGLIALVSIIVILIVFKQIEFVGINPNAQYGLIIAFLGAFLIQSAMEEVICRGYIFHKLKNKLSIFCSILISFMFFAVFHFFELFNDGILLGIVGILNLMLPSIILALLVLKDENLYSAIGFHFVWNFTVFSIIGLNLSGIESNNISLLSFNSSNNFLTGASYGIESSIITTIVLSLILIFVLKNNKSNT